jgi:hypothetical protein
VKEGTKVMKTIELLKFSEEFLRKIDKTGIRTNDVNYISLYDEFIKMKDAGEKTAYIVAVLAEKYGISERQVYYLIKRFEACI